VEQFDDTAVDPGAPPVFVDDTGRRRTRARRVGRILVLGFVGYLALLAAGFARDPKLGAIGLPTFGLPGLVHPQSAPTVLGEATTGPSPDTAGAGGDETLNLVPSKATRAIDTSRRATPGPAGGGGAGPGAGQPTPGPVPAAPATGQPAPTTTTSTTPTTVPANPGHGSKGSTTTTSTTPTTTPTTTTTTPPGQANAASAKGPDGSGPPGQLRRATTGTTAPGAGG
jgi:hypothetical protein